MATIAWFSALPLLFLLYAAPPLTAIKRNSSIPVLDTDGDGLTDPEEVVQGCDLGCPDTDGDGLWDGVEVALGLSPTAGQTTAGHDDALLDSDDDGYANIVEQSGGYGPADPYDSPAVPGWPQGNNWADGSSHWRSGDSDMEEQ